MTQFALKCIYCGGTGISDEHVWGRWVEKLYPLPEGIVERRTRWRSEYTADGRRFEVDATKGRSRQGGPFNYKEKIACKTCNNGWMSKLEDKMSAIQKQLDTHLAYSLNAEQIETIRKWTKLKTFAFEFLTRNDPRTPLKSGEFHDEVARQRKLRPQQFYKSQTTDDEDEVFILRKRSQAKHEGSHNFFPLGYTVVSAPALAFTYAPVCWMNLRTTSYVYSANPLVSEEIRTQRVAGLTELRTGQGAAHVSECWATNAIALDDVTCRLTCSP